MNKTSKIKIIVALILACSILVIYFIMFCNINSIYPQNKRTVYEYGDTFVTQNAEFTITNSDWLYKEDIEKDAELVEVLDPNAGYLTEEDLNLALMEMVVKNPTNETIQVDLTAFHFESEAYSMQFYYPLMLYYNDCGMYIELAQGEEKTITVPCPVAPSSFLYYNLEELKSRDYYFVCSLYPEKIMAEVKFNEA